MVLNWSLQNHRLVYNRELVEKVEKRSGSIILVKTTRCNTNLAEFLPHTVLPSHAQIISRILHTTTGLSKSQYCIWAEYIGSVGIKIFECFQKYPWEIFGKFTGNFLSLCNPPAISKLLRSRATTKTPQLNFCSLIFFTKLFFLFYFILLRCLCCCDNGFAWLRVWAFSMLFCTNAREKNTSVLDFQL